MLIKLCSWSDHSSSPGGFWLNNAKDEYLVRLYRLTKKARSMFSPKRCETFLVFKPLFECTRHHFCKRRTKYVLSVLSNPSGGIVYTTMKVR